MGVVVEYWTLQLEIYELNQTELGLKALSCFGVAMYTRPSDLARLAWDQVELLH